MLQTVAERICFVDPNNVRFGEALSVVELQQRVRVAEALPRNDGGLGPLKEKPRERRSVFIRSKTIMD